MSFSSLAAALPLIQARKIRPVAVTSRERMPQLPDVAPLSDAPGLAGYELLNWFAMFAPASSSQPILARLTEVMPKIMQRPDIKEQLAIQGIVPRSMTDTDLRAFVRSESDKFAKIIQDANITLGN
jgi:tripartite-type tricarboxylate transporter receptor subunit TctC